MNWKRRLKREGKRFFYSSTSILILLLLFKVLNYSSHDHEKDEDIPYRTYFNEHYRIFSLQLPDSLALAGEPVPMKKLDVREKLDRELLVNTYWQSHSLLLHKRAHRWFPVIEPILEEEGVPGDLKYVAMAESGLQNAVSPAGAEGFWQFMEGTAEELGLEVNENVDERYHVEKATRAACKYLKKAREKYSSWTLAVASYNVGGHRLDERIVQQKVNSYYQLLLNEETARYIYRILALKEIHRNPSKYGFHIREQDLYKPYRTTVVEVDSSISDLAAFAMEHGANYKALKILNPWLRQDHLNNKEGKTYRVRLPEEMTDEFLVEEEDSLEDGVDSLPERIEKDSAPIIEEEP